MAQRRQRVPRPHVVTVADNPIVQLKCLPSEDEIDIAAILHQTLVRFEFVLGTSFDLQLMDLDGTEIFATCRFMVTKAKDRLITSDVNTYQTLSKTVTDRECQPISPPIFFNDEARVFFASKQEEVVEAVEVPDQQPDPKPAAKKTVKRRRRLEETA